MQKRLKSSLTKIGDVISTVKENLGLNKNLDIAALKEIWPLVTSFNTASNSQPAYFDKENNIVITVKSSTLATELSMQKPSIISKLRQATKDTNITFKDIRFVLRT